ncbi:4Fe-4S dicluster domain-containing protein [Helicobacter ailurogastricus]|uniref:Ferredoxin-type protein NapF (Periplasmic nitrate reductase) n=1 Tax=Helicobacter ailurogastricus TaxID=1578720 RepID=A0A0K2X9C2_9HELI|nr:4Fe-4S dicluster domain-containing protein [Helicobacter ailurogastricus]CRF41685.1 Ferredoxin-type protein NapF (periplasmic nitrate reductase) [Helicobacter ailurogastricus]CRF42676.1 Ferredoxin-type protein NapF (periplasmic nitrate reductase) [Helicobacter ailurogastricus]CRF44438.1 Ferredoxin-type protein NapF (periplasmic nitrate reductase) [Helicobacter ailurogastricus]CRF52672.1 Ferredoxin-type protein NapF (periplasmic nitrate reductase) [Helicobacter ailurogastricus]BDQ29806.1 hyp
MDKKPLRDIFKAQGKPFAVPLPYFNRKRAMECVECVGGCVPSCPEKIVFKESGQAPHLDFSKSGCTFCGACLRACKECGGVLEQSLGGIEAVALIDTAKCLGHQGVVCVACQDACKDKAIHFLGMFKPRIDLGACTGCGFCVGVCPTEAILFMKRSV